MSKYLKSINDFKGLSIRMKYNSKFADSCYLNDNLTLPFELLVEEFNRETNENLYIFFIPQLSDLNLKTNYCLRYIENLKNVKDIRSIVDLNICKQKKTWWENSTNYMLRMDMGDISIN